MATQTEVPLLRGDNYPMWVKAMKRHLEGAGLYSLISGDRKQPKPPIVPSGSTIISTDDGEPQSNDTGYLNCWYRYVADLNRFRGDQERVRALILSGLHSAVLMKYEDDDTL
jgi:hypothetical protein